MNGLYTLYSNWLPLLWIAFFRMLGVVIIMPLLSSKNLGGSINRNGVVMAIILPTLPALHSMNISLPIDNIPLIFVFLLKEFIIGFFIGFISAIPFWAIDAACYMIDTMRGESIAAVLNPAVGTTSTVYGILFSQLLTVLFFVSGGVNVTLTAFYHSYSIIPPGSNLFPGRDLIKFILSLWNTLFSLMLRFALPSMGIMLMVDIGFGLLNRAASQMNVFFLAMPAKSAIVLFLLIMTLSVSLTQYHSYFFRAGELINHAMRILSEH